MWPCDEAPRPHAELYDADMSSVSYDHQHPHIEELMTLYNSVGWTAYTTHPYKMEGLLDRVDQVRCARTDGELIGFSRAISDGVQVALIQDLLVHPKWQRHGIGCHLLTSMMEHYSGLRQIVLLSDDIPEIIAFYESCGLHDIAREEGKAFVRYLYE